MDKDTGDALQDVLVGDSIQKEPEPESDTLLTRSVQSFSGPLPPPAVLMGYEEIVPGAAERIIAMAEGEQKHRHKIETLVSRKTMALRGKGQIFAFLISLSVISAATFFGSIGEGKIALAMVSIDLVALASIFISGKYFSSKEKPKQEEDDLDVQ